MSVIEISKSTIPVLKYLDYDGMLIDHPDYNANQLGLLSVSASDYSTDKDKIRFVIDVLTPFLGGWNSYSKLFRDNICIVSPLLTEVLTVGLIEYSLEDVLKTLKGQRFVGVMIYGLGLTTMFYDIRVLDDGSNADFRFFQMYEGRFLSAAAGFDDIFVCKMYREIGARFGHKDDWDILSDFMWIPVLCNYLLRYCNINYYPIDRNCHFDVSTGESFDYYSGYPAVYLDSFYLHKLREKKGSIPMCKFEKRKVKDGERFVDKIFIVEK